MNFEILGYDKLTKYAESIGFAELVNSPYIMAVLLIIAVLFLWNLIVLLVKRPGHQDFRSAIMSLGILGTFIGVSIGLWNFDTGEIEASVPGLLAGLKLAFSTSVAGIFLSVVLSILRQFFASGVRDTDPSEQIKRLRDDFKKTNKALEKIAENSAKHNEELGSIRTDFVVRSKQSKKLVKAGFDEVKQTLGNIAENSAKGSAELGAFRSDFDDRSKQSIELVKDKFSKVNKTLSESLEKISEGANREIIKALDESIHRFNQNLTEQFGENFSRLNDACLKLVEWQKKHQQEVEATHRQLTDSVSALATTEKTIVAISKRNEDVLKIYDSLRDIIETYDNQTKALTVHLEKYGALADNAEKMFADADSRFAKITNALEDMANNMAKSNKSIADNISQSVADIHSTVTNQSKALRELTKETAKNMTENNQKVADNLGKSVTNIQSTVIQQSQELQSLANSIVSSTKDMEDAMVSITKQLGEDYAKFVRGVEHIARMAPPSDQEQQ